MAEGGDIHHESRAKWPISADDYELEEIIGNACFCQNARADFHILLTI